MKQRFRGVSSNNPAMHTVAGFLGGRFSRLSLNNPMFDLSEFMFDLSFRFHNGHLSALVNLDEHRPALRSFYFIGEVCALRQSVVMRNTEYVHINPLTEGFKKTH